MGAVEGISDPDREFTWVLLSLKDLKPQAPAVGSNPALWCALAHDPNCGMVPGFCESSAVGPDGLEGYTSETKCFYPLNGAECQTNKFVVVPFQNRSKTPVGPRHCMEGSMKRWCAVVQTPFGQIPGKADSDQNCWYSHGGKEFHVRSGFEYVCP